MKKELFLLRKQNVLCRLSSSLVKKKKEKLTNEELKQNDQRTKKVDDKARSLILVR